MKLQLIPPAWIKVSAVDIEPFNPDIHHIEGHSNTGISDHMTPLIDPQIWKVSGNVAQSITFRYVYNDLSVSMIEHYYVPAPTAFDTTTYVITY